MKSEDLHGNAPDQSEIALILTDVINDFEFEGGDELFRSALPAANNIARLKKRAHQARVPVIYVNDNFGRWRSDFKRCYSLFAGRREGPANRRTSAA